MHNTTPQYIQVLLPRPFGYPFDYRVPEGIVVVEGAFVSVPFGKNELCGVVWSIEEPQTDKTKIKDIIEVIDIPPMKKNLRKFISWVADYSLAETGSVLAMAVREAAVQVLDIRYIRCQISDVRCQIRLTKQRQKVLDLFYTTPLSISEITEQAGVSRNVVNSLIKAGALQEVTVLPDIPEIKMSSLQLSDDQEKAANILRSRLGKYNTILLDGVTGSGKTEVYFEAIKEVIPEKQALILLPEIVLTSQLVKRFKKRFGFEPILWHSSLTKKQRRKNWYEVASGRAKLIIGARSALFLPFENLGLIIVDEEHESSFKQEEGVIYHGRDMAVTRAFLENIPIILVSASPSLETVTNVENGKFERIHLGTRHGNATMPDIEIVDMRLDKLESGRWISKKLKNALIDTIGRNEQSMLYLNRRGYAPLMLCRSCGFRFQCSDCSAWLVEHRTRRSSYLQCHHCGITKYVPKKCPECDGEEFASCGPGVERLKEEVMEIFPDAKIALMTSDIITSPEDAEEIITNIESGNIDIIIGTQMIAKGHHFSKLTLVGVVDADIGVEGGDLRATERSFQLLHQVSGRAGREKLKGKAIIQSYMPEHAVIKALKSGDRDTFMKDEMLRRKRSGMPPFSRLASIILSGNDEVEVQKEAKSLARNAPFGKGIKILGPSPAPLSLLRGKYRYRLLVIADRNISIQKLLRAWLPVKKGKVRIKADIDPYSFM